MNFFFRVNWDWHVTFSLYASKNCLVMNSNEAFQNKLCILSHLAPTFSSVKLKNTQYIQWKNVTFQLMRWAYCCRIIMYEKFKISKEKFCEIWKLLHFFLKKCLCVFSLCLFFLPRSLLPFGKNLDSKRIIFFEWPYSKILPCLLSRGLCKHMRLNECIIKVMLVMVVDMEVKPRDKMVIKSIQFLDFFFIMEWFIGHRKLCYLSLIQCVTNIS